MAGPDRVGICARKTGYDGLLPTGSGPEIRSGREMRVFARARAYDGQGQRLIQTRSELPTR